MKIKTFNSLLKYRSTQEKEALQRYAEALSEEEDLSIKITQEKNRLKELIAQSEEASKLGISTAELIMSREAIDYQDAHVKQIEFELNLASEAVEHARKMLVAKSIDKKLADKLLSKEKERISEKKKKEENKFIDEVASRRNPHEDP